MRVSQLITPTKKPNPTSKSKSKSKSRSKQISGLLSTQNNFYFCHYKNAMYMGGMKSFTKNGYGIIIHDNGGSAICSYYNDFKHGHNIVYYENCLMSVLYDKNKVLQIVVRLPSYLLYLRYNKQGQIDGKGILIDYPNRNIIYLAYKKNVLINRKQQKQYIVINRVFQHQNLQFLLGTSHTKALKFQYQGIQNISAIKTGNKINIGYNKKGFLNGLSFVFNTKQPVDVNDSKCINNFYLKLIQRGNYLNSQLNGMGEKWFKNGNYYIGDFKDNVFQGRGILKNEEKNNWVHGCFIKGNMSQLIQYSHEGDLTKFKKLVSTMHERKSNWINKQILLENPQTYEKQIQKIINNKPIENMKTLEQRKQQVLRKIQNNFICEDVNASVTFVTDSKIQNSQQMNINVHEAQNSLESGKISNFFQTPNKISNDRSDKNTTENQKRSIYNIRILQNSNKMENNLDRTSSSSIKKLGQGSKSRLHTQQKQSMATSQIQNQSPTFRLDSKRLVNKSRIFKNSPNQKLKNPLNFIYTRIDN